MSEVLLEAEDIRIRFAKRSGRKNQVVRAVDGLSFAVDPGETFGLVGESGSGKSTAGNAAIGLQELFSGTVRYRGEPMPVPGSARWRDLRRQLQVVFQDPFSSLNPRWTIRQALSEPLKLHGLASAEERDGAIARLLEQVGLGAELAARYPAALSGGQRQRVCIARALAVQPELIVCDEITSALDVSTQAQIISLLQDLKAQTQVALIFISHDLGLVRGVADRIGVMYLGRFVETGETGKIFARPLHPYTIALLHAVPVPDPEREAARKHQPLHGEIPDPADPPSGCYFRTRCPYATDICAAEAPAFEEMEDGHRVACHHVREIEQGVRRS